MPESTKNQHLSFNFEVQNRWKTSSQKKHHDLFLFLKSQITFVFISYHFYRIYQLYMLYKT